jgi:uncharacterized protein (DUF4415 family)
MRKEYDFSQAMKVKDVPHLVKLQSENAGKTRITTYLDSDLVEWLKIRSKAEHKGYQTILNELLRQSVTPVKIIDEETLRKVIREELKTAA